MYVLRNDSSHISKIVKQMMVMLKRILSVTVTVTMLRISLSQVHPQGVGVSVGVFANVFVGMEEED